ncbi:MAG: hypothetical protein HYW01_13885 [Deltaproteobacteria bacterium]|nr:hypothetical protein [Deltaproteobacteria bacterium]
MQENIQAQDLKQSIVMAFNLGVWLKQQKGQTGNVSEAAKELKDMIYWNLNKQYGETYPADLLNTNVEYFLQIALLGYILPEVCLPDEELKSRLLALIEAKARGGAFQPAVEEQTTEITFHN